THAAHFVHRCARMTPDRAPRAHRAPPRILLVMPEHWERVLVRAELLERGYDGAGAPDLASALDYPALELGRDAVRAILVDERALANMPDELRRLRAKHPLARWLVLTRAGGAAPQGPWQRVLRRPLAIGAVVDALAELVGGSGNRA